MANLQMKTDRAICTRCGQAFVRRSGFFPVSHGSMYKGLGYIPICKTCLDEMYTIYLSKCDNSKDAVRQMCRALNLYWNDDLFERLIVKNTPRTILARYVAGLNKTAFVGLCYDDTLIEENSLWDFGQKDCSECNATTEGSDTIPEERDHAEESPQVDAEADAEEEIEVPDEVRLFWGTGYPPAMYIELEERRKFWKSQLPDVEFDAGAEAILRQICALEIDINRDRAAGRAVDKGVAALNNLLGSANLKPAQKNKVASDDSESALINTPLGVWLQRYETQRPLPEIENDLKDVNHIKKYIFTWMGHLCKMLGVKNGYTKLYEEEIEALRVNKPEFNDDDEEDLIIHSFDDGGDVS